jgi:hypothetical protein
MYEKNTYSLLVGRENTRLIIVVAAHANKDEIDTSTPFLIWD